MIWNDAVSAWRWLMMLACLAPLQALSAADELLVVDHQQAHAVIVLPANPLPAVSYAAQELQYHIRQATGVTLEIQPETQALPAGKSGLYLGDTQQARQAGIDASSLPENSFVIHPVEQGLLLAGQDSDGQPLGGYTNRTRTGSLYAVYELLETQMGVRWLWPGELGEVIPRRDRLAFKPQEIKVEYPYAWAHLRVNPNVGRQGWASDESRQDFLAAQAVFLRRHRFSQLNDLRTSHSFEKYWSRFGQEHPEFFAQSPQGVRGPLVDDGTGVRATMCVSQPALWQRIIQDWKDRKGPQRNLVIPLGENDSPGLCACETCRSWDVDQPGFRTGLYWSGRQSPKLADRYGALSRAMGFRGPDAPSLSDRYARFYLEVQKQASTPGFTPMVAGFAYANYAAPPTRTRLNDRVIISLVPGMGEGFYFPWTQRKREQFRRQWQGWRQAGARLMLRPNYTLSGHNFPIHYAQELGEDFQFAVRNGLIATDFDSLTGSWATQGPTLYLLSRIHVRRDWPIGQILDEYYAAFGGASGAVRAYFDHWQAVSQSVTDQRMEEILTLAGEQSLHRAWYKFAPYIFTPEVMARGRQLLGQAMLAAGDDELARLRVGFLEKGLRHAELTLAVEAAHQAYRQQPTLAQLDSCRLAMRTLLAFRRENERQFINNMGYLYVNEIRHWDYALAKLDKLGRMLPDTWRFQWDPQDQGQAQQWQSPGLDDGNWQPISAGAYWSQQPIGQAWRDAHQGKDYQGVAWYRNRFEAGPAQAGGKILLLFGAADAACKVYVNGKLALDRPFPYQGNKESWAEAFEVDITQLVHADKPNLLAVRVDSVSGPGGLWKPVMLLEREPSAAPAQRLDESPGNRVANPSFLPGRQHSNAWRYLPSQGKSEFRYDAQQALFGTHAGRMRFEDAATGRLVQSIEHIETGKPHRLTIHYRTSPAFTGRITPNVAGVKASFGNTQGRWQTIQLDLTPDKSPLYLSIWVYKATGEVWIDGVELVARPQDTIQERIVP